MQIWATSFYRCFLKKHEYAPSKTQALNFEVIFRIEAVDAERCGTDGTRSAIEVGGVAETEVEARRSVLHERGEKSARQCCGMDGEGSRVARRLSDAVVAKDAVRDASDAPCDAVAAGRFGIRHCALKRQAVRTEYGCVFTVGETFRTSCEGWQRLTLHDFLRIGGQREIARRALTLGVVAAQSKTYDSTTAADASKFGAALNNTVAGDSVTATATGAAYNSKDVATANAVSYTGVALAGADAANYSLAATTAQGAGTITHRELTLTAAPHSIVQGEPLPSFTGRAEGFADGEDASVLGAGGLTFESTVKNTETPGSYGVTGRIGGVTDGVLGNYRIRQATGNATAFTVNAMPTIGGILAALVQDAAPRFDFGFGDTVYLYGTARPIRAATLGLYRFDAEDDLEIQGLRL